MQIIETLRTLKQVHDIFIRACGISINSTFICFRSYDLTTSRVEIFLPFINSLGVENLHLESSHYGIIHS